LWTKRVYREVFEMSATDSTEQEPWLLWAVSYILAGLRDVQASNEGTTRQLGGDV
jgi:hypothetical protein